jgi:hypothetical protein
MSVEIGIFLGMTGALILLGALLSSSEPLRKARKPRDINVTMPRAGQASREKTAAK